MIYPTNDNVLVKLTPQEEELSNGGIVLPQSRRQGPPDRGVVEAAGPKSSYSKGQRVMFSNYASHEAGENLLIISDQSVIAVLD